MQDKDRKVARTARRLVGAAALMFGFGFALVPLYNVLCEVAGVNGKSGALVNESAIPAPRNAAEAREVTVEFMASTNGDLPWDFRPQVARMKVRLGETAEAVYVARNRSVHEVTGQAIPSVAPGPAAKHFHKFECFCFTEQKLAPGEQKDMKVRFRIDPELGDDIRTLTLSYTFFDLHKDGVGSHVGHDAAGG